MANDLRIDDRISENFPSQGMPQAPFVGPDKVLSAKIVPQDLTSFFPAGKSFWQQLAKKWQDLQSGFLGKKDFPSPITLILKDLWPLNSEPQIHRLHWTTEIVFQAQDKQLVKDQASFEAYLTIHPTTAKILVKLTDQSSVTKEGLVPLATIRGLNFEIYVDAQFPCSNATIHLLGFSIGRDSTGTLRPYNILYSGKSYEDSWAAADGRAKIETFILDNLKTLNLEKILAALSETSAAIPVKEMQPVKANQVYAAEFPPLKSSAVSNSSVDVFLEKLGEYLSHGSTSGEWEFNVGRQPLGQTGLVISIPQRGEKAPVRLRFSTTVQENPGQLQNTFEIEDFDLQLDGNSIRIERADEQRSDFAVEISESSLHLSPDQLKPQLFLKNVVVNWKGEHGEIYGADLHDVVFDLPDNMAALLREKDITTLFKTIVTMFRDFDFSQTQMHFSIGQGSYSLPLGEGENTKSLSVTMKGNSLEGDLIGGTGNEITARLRNTPNSPTMVNFAITKSGKQPLTFAGNLGDFQADFVMDVSGDPCLSSFQGISVDTLSEALLTLSSGDQVAADHAVGLRLEKQDNASTEIPSPLLLQIEQVGGLAYQGIKVDGSNLACRIRDKTNQYQFPVEIEVQKGKLFHQQIAADFALIQAGFGEAPVKYIRAFLEGQVDGEIEGTEIALEGRGVCEFTTRVAPDTKPTNDLKASWNGKAFMASEGGSLAPTLCSDSLGFRLDGHVGATGLGIHSLDLRGNLLLPNVNLRNAYLNLVDHAGEGLQVAFDQTSPIRNFSPTAKISGGADLWNFQISPDWEVMEKNLQFSGQRQGNTLHFLFPEESSSRVLAKSESPCSSWRFSTFLKDLTLTLENNPADGSLRFPTLHAAFTNSRYFRFLSENSRDVVNASVPGTVSVLVDLTIGTSAIPNRILQLDYDENKGPVTYETNRSDLAQQQRVQFSDFSANHGRFQMMDVLVNRSRTPQDSFGKLGIFQAPMIDGRYEWKTGGEFFIGLGGDLRVREKENTIVSGVKDWHFPNAHLEISSRVHEDQLGFRFFNGPTSLDFSKEVADKSMGKAKLNLDQVQFQGSINPKTGTLHVNQGLNLLEALGLQPTNPDFAAKAHQGTIPLTTFPAGTFMYDAFADPERNAIIGRIHTNMDEIARMRPRLARTLTRMFRKKHHQPLSHLTFEALSADEKIAVLRAWTLLDSKISLDGLFTHGKVLRLNYDSDLVFDPNEKKSFKGTKVKLDAYILISPDQDMEMDDGEELGFTKNPPILHVEFESGLVDPKGTPQTGKFRLSFCHLEKERGNRLEISKNGNRLKIGRNGQLAKIPVLGWALSPLMPNPEENYVVGAWVGMNVYVDSFGVEFIPGERPRVFIQGDRGKTILNTDFQETRIDPIRDGYQNAQAYLENLFYPLIQFNGWGEDIYQRDPVNNRSYFIDNQALQAHDGYLQADGAGSPPGWIGRWGHMVWPKKLSADGQSMKFYRCEE